MEIGSRKRKSLHAATEVVGPEHAREVVRQRFQAELAAVQRLLKKAAAEPVPQFEEPPAKRSKKASPPPVIKRKKTTDSEKEQLQANLAEEEEEDVDIVGGVSPLAIVSAPLPPAEEEDEEYVDICGDASPVARPKNLGDGSGSPSSSSSSDSGSASDSDSDSDSDESVDSPAPPERAATPAITELIARAKDKESLERQRKEARCRAREKTRQDVLETVRTAMPTETIHQTVLKSLCIHEYGLGPYSLFRQLGLCLKTDDDQEEQKHHQIFQEELEEGEIRI